MSKPNFIIFLTDDQGYGDLSCMGAPDFQTPHIDSLAQGGARFTSWYSNSPVCSPARASLLTGRYPGNAGVRSILAGHRTATGLPSHVPTIATALKPLGYQTYMAGKWHLGLRDESRPHNHGFDHWYGFLAGCIDYYSHIFYWGMNRPGPGLNPTHDLWRDGREIWNNGQYFTEAIAENAINYIRQAAQSDKPFFLYVPFNAPHYPMHAPEKYMTRFAHLPWDRQVMAAMLSAVDDAVGLIMSEVEKMGLSDYTCTFFTADNGPSRESRNWLDGNQDDYYGGTTGGLKGHKFSLYEGGIRVPGIVNWPTEISPGQILDTPCASMDIFPTCLEAAEGDGSSFELDGQSLLPLAVRSKQPPERTICWEMGGQNAVRKGKWKLVLKGQLTEGTPSEDDVHLSNLDHDMCEQSNLKDDHLEIVTELEREILVWREQIETRWQEEFSIERQGTVTHKTK
jgi:arylsulfatase A-like enzyme